MGRFGSTALGLGLRNILLVRRVPSVFIPSLVMPLFILVATSGAFHGIASLDIFGGASYVQFTVPMAATMGASFAGINSGMTLARDIEGGFFYRLAASPAPRAALLVGPLIAAMARSLFTTTVVYVASIVLGAGFPGVGSAIVVYLLAMGFACAASLWAMGVALRARTIQSAPLMQVIVFVAIFTSVAYAPRPAMQGWLRTVADYNPVTRVLEASRSAELHGVSWAATWPGLVSLAGLLAVVSLFSITGLRRMTER